VSDETETKIIITHRGNRASIGIQKTSCDPVFFTTEGNIHTALPHIPEYIEEAERKWQTNPLYPKAELPAAPGPTGTTVTTSQSNSAAKPANKQQETMF
jgi:hypothetical protein